MLPRSSQNDAANRVLSGKLLRSLSFVKALASAKNQQDRSRIKSAYVAGTHLSGRSQPNPYRRRLRTLIQLESAAEWDESKHPRDDSGKFTSGGGGSDKSQWHVTPTPEGGWTVESPTGDSYYSEASTADEALGEAATKIGYAAPTQDALKEAYHEALTESATTKISDWPITDDVVRIEGQHYPSAVQEAYAEWADDLDHDERGAVIDYTGDDYKAINRYLREGQLSGDNDPESYRDEYDEWVSDQQNEERGSAQTEFSQNLQDRADEVNDIWTEMQEQRITESKYGDVSTHPELPGLENIAKPAPKIEMDELLKGVDISSSLSDDERDTIKERLAGTGGPAPVTWKVSERMFDDQYETPDWEGASFESWLEDNHPDAYRALMFDTSSLDDKIENINSALKKAPKPPPPELVWRGLDASVVHDILGNAAAGDEIQLDGFQSTSIDPRFAKTWASYGSVFEIKPKRGAYVDHISANRGEKEFLLPHGQRYRLRGVTEVEIRGMHGGSYRTKVYQLEQL